MFIIDSLTKTYGGSTVLDDVSFCAPDGAITGFVGPNGAGKTTTMRIITGLTHATAGHVEVGGEPFPAAQRPARRLGVFLSAEGIPPSMTAHAYLDYACRTQGMPTSRVAQVLADVDLSWAAHHRVTSFSLGMRQRLGIGAATLTEPSHLILDEPANGLDPDGIRWFRDFVRASADSGVSILLSSHHMRELGAVADQVVMIDGGRILAHGSLQEFLAAAQAQHGEQQVVYLEVSDPDTARHALLAQGITVERQHHGLMAHGVPPERLAALVVESGVGLTHLAAQAQSLEDTYFTLLGASNGRN
ncbi:ABC transporter ATP-binding protein [Nesterenkonia sp. PF2B19]|uniref:ABC transporter ATP-binding protein n=1 Tax=unclassified Nesterenkonia TaxID=2629769 RepID=UPI000A19F968|nr:ATP-binding cassette domain-containing protein [Nesterenkonia sp. PF2B19]OSM42876.1 hypothetical protein BCY76_011850 [Nesterenkonia sp. PF2B19]